MTVNTNQSVGNWQETGGTGSSDAIRYTQAYDLVDNVSVVRGRHTFRFGGEYRRLQAEVTNPDHYQSGNFGFDNSYTSSCANNSLCSGGAGGAGIADFLLGLPTTVNRDIVNTAPGTRLTIADTYFQDDFRVTPKLTLNLALRWDLITMYNECGHRGESRSQREYQLSQLRTQNRPRVFAGQRENRHSSGLGHHQFPRSLRSRGRHSGAELAFL
jgi:outer membrane receptor protein involved in Fe transport